MFTLFISLIITILLTPFLYLLTANLLKYIQVNRSFRPCTEESIEILLVANGGHTDIVMPTTNKYFDWSRFIPLVDFTPNTHNYISIGWGEKDFYLKAGSWENLKLSIVLKALTGLNRTLIKVITYDNKPISSENDIVTAINISEEEYLKLCSYLQTQFRQHNKLNINKINHKGVDCCAGLNYNFYEAIGSYFAFKNCNCWVNIALQKAGIKTPLWVPFADGLAYCHQNITEKKLISADLSFFRQKIA